MKAKRWEAEVFRVPRFSTSWARGRRGLGYRHRNSLYNLFLVETVTACSPFLCRHFLAQITRTHTVGDRSISEEFQELLAKH